MFICYLFSEKVCVCLYLLCSLYSLDCCKMAHIIGLFSATLPPVGKCAVVPYFSTNITCSIQELLLGQIYLKIDFFLFTGPSFLSDLVSESVENCTADDKSIIKFVICHTDISFRPIIFSNFSCSPSQKYLFWSFPCQITSSPCPFLFACCLESLYLFPLLLLETSVNIFQLWFFLISPSPSNWQHHLSLVQ